MTDKVQIDSTVRIAPAASPEAPDVNMQILNELRSIRAAIVALVCSDGRFTPADFAPDNFDLPREQEN